MALYIGQTSSLLDYVERTADLPYSEEEETVNITSRVTLTSSSSQTTQARVGDGIYIPTVGCDDCGDYLDELNAVKDSLHSLDNAKADKSELDALAQEVSRALTLLRNKTNTVISMTDSNNNEVSVTVLAE